MTNGLLTLKKGFDPIVKQKHMMTSHDLWHVTGRQGALGALGIT